MQRSWGRNQPGNSTQTRSLSPWSGVCAGREEETPIAWVLKSRGASETRPRILPVVVL